jgi:hypothetical protein
MNAAPKPVTVPLAPHHSQDRNPPPISNRNPNQPAPRNSNKTNKSYSNSNRESLRLEINVTPTKQRPDHLSNREFEPLFAAPAITTRNAAIQITTMGRTAQKKAPRHLPRGFEIATRIAERRLLLRLGRSRRLGRCRTRRSSSLHRIRLIE